MVALSQKKSDYLHVMIDGHSCHTTAFDGKTP